MDSEKFAVDLAQLAPSLEELKSLGLNKRESEDFRRNYQCIARKSPLAIDGSDNLLLLLRGWDASNIQIGTVGFLKVPLKKGDGLVVGDYEGSPILMDADGEVYVENVDSRHSVLHAARDGTCFLDALMLAAQFFDKCRRGTTKIGDDRAAEEAAKECAVAAGGKKYFRFYRKLLGVS